MQKGTKKERFTITIDKTIMENLDTYRNSKEFPVPRSQIVEKALKEYFKKREVKK